MKSNRPKQILDSTFRHLEEVLEEMRQEKIKKERMVQAAKPEKSERHQEMVPSKS